MAGEQKPCPFCGGQGEVASSVIKAHTPSGRESYWWWGYCAKCDADGPTAWSKLPAISKWNRRVSG